MKFKLAAVSIALLASSASFAQATDTLAKVKASGVVTMGVRDSSGAHRVRNPRTRGEPLGAGTQRAPRPGGRPAL